MKWSWPRRLDMSGSGTGIGRFYARESIDLKRAGWNGIEAYTVRRATRIGRHVSGRHRLSQSSSLFPLNNGGPPCG